MSRLGRPFFFAQIYPSRGTYNRVIMRLDTVSKLSFRMSPPASFTIIFILAAKSLDEIPQTS